MVNDYEFEVEYNEHRLSFVGCELIGAWHYESNEEFPVGNGDESWFEDSNGERILVSFVKREAGDETLIDVKIGRDKLMTLEEIYDPGMGYRYIKPSGDDDY